jgi:hypothetical protein
MSTGEYRRSWRAEPPGTEPDMSPLLLMSLALNPSTRSIAPPRCQMTVGGGLRGRREQQAGE